MDESHLPRALLVIIPCHRPSRTRATPLLLPFILVPAAAAAVELGLGLVDGGILGADLQQRLEDLGLGLLADQGLGVLLPL